VQGGCDWLTAFGTDGKAEALFKKQLGEQELAEHEAVLAKALYKLKGVGPMEACLIAAKFGSLGALMAHFVAAPRAAACAEIAALQRASGRRVGPAAADKLWSFCMSEDPDAMYAEKE
jgi:transposase